MKKLLMFCCVVASLCYFCVTLHSFSSSGQLDFLKRPFGFKQIGSYVFKTFTAWLFSDSINEIIEEEKARLAKINEEVKLAKIDEEAKLAKIDEEERQAEIEELARLSRFEKRVIGFTLGALFGSSLSQGAGTIFGAILGSLLFA